MTQILLDSVKSPGYQYSREGGKTGRPTLNYDFFFRLSAFPAKKTFEINSND